MSHGTPDYAGAKDQRTEEAAKIVRIVGVVKQGVVPQKSNTQPCNKSQVRQFIGILKLINAKVGGVKENYSNELLNRAERRSRA